MGRQLRLEATARFWRAALQRDGDDFSTMVDALDPGLKLTPTGVLLLTDAMAGPSPPLRRRAYATLMRKLCPRHPLTQDLATLVACAPEADPAVLTAALEVLTALGHPTRTVLARAARRALVGDPGAVGYATAIATSLLPPTDAEEASLMASYSALKNRSTVTPEPRILARRCWGQG